MDYKKQLISKLEEDIKGKSELAKELIKERLKDLKQGKTVQK